MHIRELSIPDSYEITPTQHRDDRGAFLEWYRFDRLEEFIGHPLELRQANASISKRGVVRGIHFADVPRGQAKYITATHGVVLDFVVDIRVGSPMFGEWDSVLLDTVDRRAVYIAEGLGHAFVALTDNAAISYLVSDVYNPVSEHAINPLDPDVALDFRLADGSTLLSPKDASAPSLRELEAAGSLPTWSGMRSYYDSLRRDAV
ncbi:dTDP-4-dehydrorhamnose 3,5-epimerase [Leifsonia sp. H3M29-4]|uniref:dTDP-4-dehydrorhamnose 3,5-epimerase family protein n=1 Tax=Salinibacterium metalliresistens TaxID=3031321 RepID=UPI0023DB2CD6|nr:dTDP-4-dehydrorhamnose 3,5-epimerase [Salinibacterium metalliresistens]MDF1479147.1 dTDP-4-dehydrorhamnose 3,5-epimerase [Salinibacterium metalliresistens]